MKRVAIIQSSYIPWKGYFDIIDEVDLFIFYDDVQFTTRDWRTRNKIKTLTGTKWLSIPVGKSGGRDKTIRDVRISDPSWVDRHWKTIRGSYLKAPFFKQYGPLLEQRYRELASESSLSRVNTSLIQLLCEILEIDTQLDDCAHYPMEGNPTERLMGICRAAGATEYISGPSARDYLDESVFNDVDISVRFKDFSAFETYPQLHGDFEHFVSVIDLIFNVGPDARRYLFSRP